MAQGLSYYLAPLSQRPHLEEYKVLRPAAIYGHTFGVVGSFFMICMLTYSLRKRVKLFKNWGKLGKWLDIHIFLGVYGPLLVILHTTFKVQGLVAVSFWSMVAVAVSGIFGRYLYLQIPRNIHGDELSVKELEEMSRSYYDKLKNEFGFTDETLKSLEEHSTSGIDKNVGPAQVLWILIKDDIKHLFAGQKAQRRLASKLNIPREAISRFLKANRRQDLLERRIALMNGVQQMFHYWHVIHKPFAFVMYLIMIVHIGVAVWTGYKWIF